MPNLPAAMNARGRSACYPRSTFYPLSDDPSMRNRRITNTYFRTCSTRRCRSQAPLCVYTLRLVSNQSEGTIASLRYFFGGDRPSQTPHQTLSRSRIHGIRLGSRQHKGGISRLAPRTLACPLQSLPPILHMPCQKAMSS